MSDLSGTFAGNYQLLRKLGEGGMGEVYEAIHPELGRRAAVKVILPELAKNAEIVARFLREARAATVIRHRGLIEVYDFGQLASGAPYFVMEFLMGRSLGARIQERPLTLTESMSVLGECAEALDLLHQAGMVHRDLKPDNIFLIGGEVTPGAIKILDFGLIKLLQTEPEGATRTGALMGTPRYMSPEQCKGTRHIGPESDVYAMACIFFEMIAGRPPFLAENPTQAIYAHVFESPPSLCMLRPELPAAVDAAIARALSKEPAHRFLSVSTMLSAIHAALAQASVPTRASVSPASGPGTPTATSSTNARLPRTAWRRSWGVVAGATLVAGGVGLAFVSNSSAPTQPESLSKLQADASPASKMAMETSDGDAIDASTFFSSASEAANLQGRRHWYGMGDIPRNTDEAYKWFKQACKLGNPSGCGNAVYALVRSGASDADRQREASALDAACGVHGAACFMGAIGQSHPTLTEIACNSGVPMGCLVRAVQVIGQARDSGHPEWYRAGDEWTVRANLMIDPERQIDGRLVLATMYGVGIAVDRDPLEATKVLEAGCVELDSSCCALAACIARGPVRDPWLDVAARCRSELGPTLRRLVEVARARDRYAQ